MQGLMMDEPLLISSLIKHAAMNYADKGVVSRETDGTLVRLTYREVEARAQFGGVARCAWHYLRRQGGHHCVEYP